MTPIDLRFNERNWIAMFSNTANTALRSQTDETARRIITLLTGAPPPGDTTPPDVPTNLVAAAGVESVSLSWTASLALDTNRYRVQRSLTSGAGFATIVETLDTAVIDGGLTGGTEYFYKVAAIDDSGNVSAYTAEVFATPTASGGSGTPPLPPINVGTTNLDGRVLLRWNPGDAASVRYDVHRDNNTGGPYTTIATGIVGAPPSIAYLDTAVVNGSTYYYVITAFNSNGDESVNSSEVIGTPTAGVNTDPHPVEITSITQGYLSLKLVWTPNTDTDFALYRIKYGTVTATYTEEVEVTNQSLQTIQITGLDPGTDYFFVIEVEDTAGNLSTESAEETEATFDATSPEGPGVDIPPAAVSGLHIIEEGDGFVRIGWTPNIEPDASAYILFRNNGLGGPVAPGASVQHPVSAFTFTNLVNDRNYVFGVWCQDTAGYTSPMVTIIGTPSANTGTVIPPGGGTGTGGQFSGDTGLGPLHKAPGATFDVVINASSGQFVTSQNMWGLIFSLIDQFQITNSPPYTSSTWSWLNKRVAILLPEREFNVAESGKKGVGINTNHTFMINVAFPQAAGVQWHFIAPWPTASLGDSQATAAATTKKFRLIHEFPNGTTFTQGGGSLIEFFHNDLSPGTRVGFWWMEFQATARETIKINNTSTYGFFTLYGCDLLNDIPFDLTLGSDMRDHISTDGISIDQLHYCYFDYPYTVRHHIYERSSGPAGTCYVTNTTFDRCGGQVWQQTRRPAERPDQTNGAASAGKQYWVNVVMKNFGRASTWSSAAITQYGGRRDIDMEGCVIVNALLGRYGTAAFPWVNLSNFYAYSLPSVGFADTRCSDVLAYSPEIDTGSWMSTAGHHCGKFKMRDCDFYIREPQSGILRIWHSTEVDIEDSSLLTGATAVDPNALILCDRTTLPPYQTSPPAFPVLSVHIESNNTSARRTSFVAAHPEVPANALLTTRVIYRRPPPVVGQRSISSTVAPWLNANATQTINATNLI